MTMPQRLRNRSIALGLILLFAMLMGPGPGLHLVNPDPADPGSFRTVLGLPIVYAWGLLWFAVQTTVLLIAYFTVWTREEDPTAGDE